MSGRPMRRIVVDEVPYLWRVTHRHDVLPEGEPGACRCQELLTAYREGHKASPLRIVFSGGPGIDAGYPQAGTIHVYGPPHRSHNLNTPSLAAHLLRTALERGWSPETSRSPFQIEDGLSLLPEGSE